MSRFLISPEFAGLDDKLAEFNQFLNVARGMGEVCMVGVERQGATAWDVGGRIRVDMPFVGRSRVIEGEFPLRYFMQGRRGLTTLDAPGRLYSGVDTELGICVVRTNNHMIQTFGRFQEDVVQRHPGSFTRS